MAGIRNYLKLLLSWSLATWYIEAHTSTVIQLLPEQTVYLVGERITVRCVTNKPSTFAVYTFYKDSAEIFKSDSSNILSLNLTTSHSGHYHCTYYMGNGNKTNSSPESSNFIRLNVIEQPPSPRLSVQPPRNVFLKDQSANLQCQIPKGQSPTVTGITLYQNEGEIHESDNYGALIYTKLQIKNSGNYSCGYTVNLTQRIIPSYFSKEVVLIVIEEPPIPRLRYAYSHQNQQIELECEVESRSFSQIHGYRFYRNGIEIESRHQVDFFIFNYTLNFDGCYSCRTFVTILGEEILSPKSMEQFLSVEGKDERQCQENMSVVNILSKQGLKFYGSILAGKLLVLISILAIFGVYLLVLQQRNQKTEAETQ